MVRLPGVKIIVVVIITIIIISRHPIAVCVRALSLSLSGPCSRNCHFDRSVACVYGGQGRVKDEGGRC